MAIRKNTPRSQETSPKLTFAEDLSCTPSEGVAFSRHFPTPSEGVGALTIDTDTRRTTLTNLLRGALCFSTD